MKHTTLCICTAAMLLALFSSFTTASVNKDDTSILKIENDLVEITPLIQSTVMLYDTTKFLKNSKQANSSKDYIPGYGTKLLTYSAFNSLKKQLEQTFNDPKALICYDPEAASALTPKERKDSGSKVCFEKINVLTFFESWCYNKHTGEIVKKQLGYSLGEWDYEKEAFRERYLFFTSQEARIKYIKNW